MKLPVTPSFRRSAAFGFALAVATGGVAASPAGAQQYQDLPPYAQPDYGRTTYEQDGGYDGFDGFGNRMIRGTIASSTKFRVLLARNDQQTAQVDLHKGTIIDPVGTVLTPGMHVQISGTWSKGVFIADRVILR